MLAIQVGRNSEKERQRAIERKEANSRHEDWSFYLPSAYRLSLLLNEEEMRRRLSFIRWLFVACLLHLLLFLLPQSLQSLKRFDGSKCAKQPSGTCSTSTHTYSQFPVIVSFSFPPLSFSMCEYCVICSFSWDSWLPIDTNQYWLRSCAIPFTWNMMDSME